MARPRRRSALLPDRYPAESEMFVADVLDAAPKGDMAGMEHPIFTLANRKDMVRRRYEWGDRFLEVIPSGEGLATIHDRDILIYIISQLMAAQNAGQPISRLIRFPAIDMLRATQRPTGGESYLRLKAALERLKGTTIETNVSTGGREILDGFGLIDSFRIIRESRDGRMLDLEVRISDWIYHAVEANEVLTISRDYFRLRKPLERKIYEIARKHAGKKREWRITLDRLREKSGSRSSKAEFHRLIQAIVAEDAESAHMPDYAVTLDEDQVVFFSRGSVPSPAPAVLEGHSLVEDTYAAAREAAPGWDVRHLEKEWRRWCEEGGVAPDHPNAHFLRFCESWFARRGRPS